MNDPNVAVGYAPIIDPVADLVREARSRAAMSDDLPWSGDLEMIRRLAAALEKEHREARRLDNTLKLAFGMKYEELVACAADCRIAEAERKRAKRERDEWKRREESLRRHYRAQAIAEFEGYERETARANRNAALAAERLEIMRRAKKSYSMDEITDHLWAADAVFAFGDVEVKE